MNTFLNIVNFILNLDESLFEIIQNYGLWTYLLLFLIVFGETGLVVTPFLLAAVIGDTVNYHIG